MAYSCPDCGSPLSASSAGGARTLSCPSCQGHLYGLSPFERMLGEGVGMRVWTGAASGGSAGTCPYCGNHMHLADGDPESPPDLAVCRLCQQVWVPAGAAGWMSSHASPAGAASASTGAPPSECGNCGAPYQPDEDGRCHWCHAQIAAPQPVVVMMQPEPVPDWSFRLI